MLRWMICAALLALLTPAASAQSGGSAPSLGLGDPAPGLRIDTWVKGAPVPKLKPGQVYVVEFWATWCGPCRQSIPHLTEIQKKYPKKEVIIIGVAASERGGYAGVRPFVTSMGDKMGYTVGIDSSGFMAMNWMGAARQQGIPTAFVVDGTGTIAWIGHPLFPAGMLDKVLDGVLAGTWDPKQEVTRQQTVAATIDKANKAFAANDTNGVLTGLDDLLRLDPGNFDQWAIQKLQILLFKFKRYDAGYKWASQLVDNQYQDNAPILNSIAWAIADGEGLEKRDLDLALRAATRANEITGSQNAQVLDTLARIHFGKGNADKAVEYETKAVALAPDDQSKQQLQKRLDEYLSGAAARRN